MNKESVANMFGNIKNVWKNKNHKENSGYMNPQTGNVLYSPESQRRSIINNWIQVGNIQNNIPYEIIMLCIIFSNNPYKNRFDFKIGEFVGYIKPKSNCIQNQKIIHCIIGRGVYIRGIWMELPNQNIVPPLNQFEAMEDEYDSEYNGLNDEWDCYLLISCERNNPTKLEIPCQYAYISGYVQTLAAGENLYKNRIGGVNANFLSLIVKYMFHYKGKEPEFEVFFQQAHISIGFEDMIEMDEWLLEFLNCVDCMENGIKNLLLAADYMSIPKLKIICIWKLICGLEVKFRKEMRDAFHFISLRLWIDKCIQYANVE
eukprot:173301_1